MSFISYPTHHAPDHLDIWTKAAISGGHVDPFCCTPEWQLSFHDSFAPECRLLIESSSDSIITFAEHVISPEEVYLTPIESHWFFGCPLLGPHAIQLFAENLPDMLRLHKTTIPKIIISGIRPEGPMPGQLIQTFDRYFDLFLHSSGIQASASLDGGIDGFLSRRSANHRKKLKKQMRRAQEHGITYERVIPNSAEEATHTYARMLAIEAKSWKGIGKCGMAETPAKEFYEAMMQRLAPIQGGRIIFARHDNTDIGFIYGAMAGSVYRGQQFSYDETWKNFSIGNLMQIEKVTWLSEDHATRYDMGPLIGPKMEYKNHWTEINTQFETWVLIAR